MGCSYPPKTLEEKDLKFEFEENNMIASSKEDKKRKIYYLFFTKKLKNL